ncbi:MAG: S8 family serine peptidase [Lachnospiraceae bacterium]|nr:S8 family serine peptidase [Lachnospiraceae bacterium]
MYKNISMKFISVILCLTLFCVSPVTVYAQVILQEDPLLLYEAEGLQEQAEDTVLLEDNSQLAEESQFIEDGLSIEGSLSEDNIHTFTEEDTCDAISGNEIVSDISVSSDNIKECDFKGMPKDYVLSEKALELKEKLAEHDVLNDLKGSVAGVDYVSDEIIFFAADEEEARMIAEAYNAELLSYEDELGIARLPFGVSVPEAVRAGLICENLPSVEANQIVYIEPQREVQWEDEISNDGAGFSMPEESDYKSWVYGDAADGIAPILNNADTYLKNTSGENYQWMHEMVNTYGAWNVTTGSKAIKVAVIDSGVNAAHEDLKGRVTCIKVGNIDVSPVIDHGTHCAGIIGATLNNGKGGAGIAPGVSILSLNISSDTKGSMELSDILKAINLAVDNNADIINMSFGGYTYSAGIEAAIERAYKKGITMVAAAGNKECNNNEYPAVYDHVISVASVNEDGTPSEYTNYGKTVDISAPGSNVMSTVIDGYDIKSGTSMAAPVVSGVAALYMSKFGNPGPDKMEKLLKATATPIKGSGYGKGIVNAANLFKADKGAPNISVYDKNGKIIEQPSKGVSKGAYVKICRDAEASIYKDSYIIYTLNGSVPAIKDGELVNGDVYTGIIKLDEQPSGTKLTIKAMAVNEAGLISDKSSLTVKTYDKTKEAANPVSKAELDKTKLTLTYNEHKAGSSELILTSLKDKNNNELKLSEHAYEWISSNEGVAVVEETSTGKAVVKAVGAGNAVISLKLLDGSKKSAACKVNVKRIADSVTILGQSAIQPGASASYKVSVLPSTVKDKKVSWSVNDKTGNITVNPKTGRVTVSKSASFGSEFVLTAATADGSDLKATLTVKVKAKASNAKIIKASTDKNTRAVYVYDNKGLLKDIRIYSADMPEFTGYENVVTLESLIDEKTGCSDVSYTVSDKKILDITQNGSGVRVKALKAGKSKVTLKTTDGSNKSAVVNITVINPASGITLTPNDYSYNNIAVGKSKNIGVALGSAYGKPSISTVAYSYIAYAGCKVRTYSSNGLEYVSGYTDGTKNITDVLKNTGAVSISAKGKLSINEKKWRVALNKAGISADDTVKLVITSKTTDGTGFSDSIVYYASPKAKIFVPFSPGSTRKIIVSAGYITECYVGSDRYMGRLALSNTKPEVTSAVYDCCYYQDGYYIYSFVICGMKPGSGSVKINTVDGSGIKVSVPVKVYKY